MSTLKSFCIGAQYLGYESLQNLSIEDVSRVFHEGGCSHSDSALAGFNAMLRGRESLPFSLMEEHSQLTRINLKLDKPTQKQHPVIPLRIYKSQLKRCTTFIDNVHSDITILREAAFEFINNAQTLKEQLIYALRNGERKPAGILADSRDGVSVKRFLKELKNADIPLQDNKGSSQHFRNIHADIGQRVKNTRIRKGFKQIDLAREAGCIKDTVGEVERLNRKGPSLKNIVEALGENYEEFAFEPVDSANTEQNDSNDSWMQIFESCKPSLVIKYDKKGCWNGLTITPRTIAGRKIIKVNDLLDLFHEINCCSIYSIAALTGMRVHELAILDPVYCAQHVFAGRDRRKIPVITTLTTKITETGQVKNRVFVTCDAAHRATALLNAVHGAYRKYLPEGSQNCMFVALEYFIHMQIPKECPAYISQRLSKSTSKYFDSKELKVTEEDIRMLTISENGNIEYYTVGSQWESTGHQLRRSLTFYLVGMELASFIELKEQLGHISLAMTMYYGANATDFTEFYREMENERLEQQASKMSVIHSRIRNGERIAGGRGKAMRKEMEHHGFEESIFNRTCSKEFWKKELKLKKDVMRVHAIAPGIICTNISCDMRIEIDMSECIDCEFDFIESASYAEMARQVAMEKIAWMETNNQVHADMLIKELITIRSAEKIMHDLDFDFDRYKPGPVFNDYLIPTKTSTFKK